MSNPTRDDRGCLVRLCYGMEIQAGFVAVTLERLKEMGLSPRLAEKEAYGDV
jgi:hypothetical protein